MTKSELIQTEVFVLRVDRHRYAGGSRFIVDIFFADYGNCGGQAMTKLTIPDRFEVHAGHAYMISEQMTDHNTGDVVDIVEIQ